MQLGLIFRPNNVIARICWRHGSASDEYGNEALLKWEPVPAVEILTGRLILPSTSALAFPTHNKPVSSHLV
jgi:hypothetical protein